MGTLLRRVTTALLTLISVTTWVGWSHAAVSPVLLSLGQITQGLASPGALDVDAAGRLYVADARLAIILKYDPSGVLKARFSQVPVSGRGLAVTPDGHFLYASTSTGIVKFDAVTGRLLGRIGSADDPVQLGLAGPLAIDADGMVYVADLLTSEILAFTGTGGFVKRFGGKGTGQGKFGSLDSLAIVGNRLLVGDSSVGNLEVEVFTLDGQPLATLPTASGFGPTPLHVPRGIVADDQGRLYFLEYINSDLRFLDSGSYAYLGAFSRTGKGVGQLEYVKDLACDTVNRRLFVACDGGRVEIYGVDGGATPVSVNHPPSVPVPQTPVGSSIVSSVAPVLNFSAASDEDGDALHYEVKILSADAVVYSAQTTATSVPVPAGLLTENAGYTWSVQAFDSEGGASPVGTGSFIVDAESEPPTVPVLLAPLAGGVLAGSGVLSWQASVDPDPVPTTVSYLVEVATDPGFSPVVARKTVSATSLTLAELDGYAALADGGSYVWRVTAADGDGNLSAAGDAGRFTYDTALLLVTANLSGSQVYLGGNHAYPGRHVGTAPLELRDLPEGHYSLVVERAGFEPYVTRFVLAGTGNVSVYASLRPSWQAAGVQLFNNGINGRSGLSLGNENPSAPFLTDFDSDGSLDLLAGGADGSLTLFPAMEVTSRGQLYFQTGRRLALPIQPGAVPFVADWDDDGRKDLLIGVADGTVKLFLNAGDEIAPAFGAGEDLAAAGSVLDAGEKAAPVVIDLDADGDKDLVVGNAVGQILAFFNQGTDTAVQLAAPVLLAQFDGAATPASVDWDADGRRDLLVAVKGRIVPLLNDLAASGTFAAGPALPLAGVQAVFPLDIDGQKGKDLIVGLDSGKLTYWTGSAGPLAPAALAGLLAKTDEVGALVVSEAPDLLGDVDKIRQQIANQSLGGAAKTASALAARLPAGKARSAAEELAWLCR